MQTALVIGGTGPTGPYVVEGLLERGYKVTIFHGGFHEVEFSGPVEHLHGDPHFKETFEETLGNRTYDLIIFTYGRLRLASELVKGRTGRFIAVGGSGGGMAGPTDPRWGPLGPPAILRESNTILETDIANKFRFRMAEAEEALMQAHREGHYSATYLGYPILYGPRQPGSHDWSIVRRVLDGRKQFIIADGGIKLENRAYVENAAHALLLVVDNPEKSAGQPYLMADENVYSLRQRIQSYARAMNHKFELIDMPWDVAVPCHVLWRGRGHYVKDTRKLQDELGYRDIVAPDEAVRRSIDFLVKNRPEPDGELEQQLGDPFDYAKEDEIIHTWTEWRKQLPKVDYPVLPPAHMYRHPAYPNEPWKRPERRSGSRA